MTGRNMDREWQSSLEHYAYIRNHLLVGIAAICLVLFLAFLSHISTSTLKEWHEYFSSVSSPSADCRTRAYFIDTPVEELGNMI